MLSVDTINTSRISLAEIVDHISNIQNIFNSFTNISNYNYGYNYDNLIQSGAHSKQVYYLYQILIILILNLKMDSNNYRNTK